MSKYMSIVNLKWLISLTFLFLVPFKTFSQIPLGYEVGLESITEKEIFNNVIFLASDSLKGRTAGSEENNIAAKFIAKKFLEYKLKPLFESQNRSKVKEDTITHEDDPCDEQLINNYFQKFVIKRSRLSDKNKLSIKNDFNNGNIEIKFDFGIDFLIQSTNVAKNQNLTLPIVFAGYGIDKGEQNYNDYLDANGKEIDVKNKFVLVVDGFPLERDNESAFSKSRNASYRNPLRKAEAAAAKGALALLVAQSPLKMEPPLTVKYQTMAANFNRQFDYLSNQKSSNIPIIFISQNILNEIFYQSGNDLIDLLEQIDKELKPRAFEIQNKKLCLEVNYNTEVINTQNVAGFLEGVDKNLKEEIIIICAHYDHIGLGYFGASNKSNAGQVHNGADDNASGTCGIIEIAEALSKAKPKRSILFIAFSAEENGLLGSRYYVHFQPLKQLEKTVAILNFDMIGRNDPEILWIGGAFYSDDIRYIIEEANKIIGFKLLYNTGFLSSASDQAAFLRKEIPAAFFFSGMHDDYHTPSDDIEKLDLSKIERVAKLGFLTSWILANQEKKPKYEELSLDERKELIRISLERDKKNRP